MSRARNKGYQDNKTDGRAPKPCVRNTRPACILLRLEQDVSHQWRQSAVPPRAARSGSAPGAQHSNAPLGTPAASSDREKGTERAKDVGRGKKKGLSKKELKLKRHR